MGIRSGPEYQQALRIVDKLAGLRLKGTSSEEDIARELDFGSTEAMHTQLKNWELPDWLVYARAPKERQGHARTPGDGKKRKARSTGDTVDLPPAEQAERLFRADLNILARYLDDLPKLREQLRGELFVSHFWGGTSQEEIYRNEFSEDEWEYWCEKYGVNPTDEAALVPISNVLPLSAGVTPWKGLSLLIAVDALVSESIGESIEPLLEALHPDPSSVDREKLYLKETVTNTRVKKDGIIYNLKAYAAQLAKVVRGGKVRTGHLPGEVPHDELWLAWESIDSLVERGFSDEDILHQIQNLFPSMCGDYTVEDIARIRKLGLQRPSE